MSAILTTSFTKGLVESMEFRFWPISTFKMIVIKVYETTGFFLKIRLYCKKIRLYCKIVTKLIEAVCKKVQQGLDLISFLFCSRKHAKNEEKPPQIPLNSHLEYEHV